MDQRAQRKALFTPCKTKEELDRWIRVFLQIRFPDRIVSEESTSSPLDMIWQLYDKAVRNDTEGFKRIMVYANRFGGKTLAAAVLETLILLHTPRNIVHMAAIKDQSKKAQEYVKGFFYRHVFRDFVIGDNDTEVKVVAYIDASGIALTEKEYEKLKPSAQLLFKRKENYIRIIVCTMQSTNGQHVEFMCVTGDTKIAVKGRRGRSAITAKGLFRRIQGLSPTGRYPEVEGQVTPTELAEAATFDWTTGGIEFRPITFGVARLANTTVVRTGSKTLEASGDHQVWSITANRMVPVATLVPGDRVAVLNRGKSGGNTVGKKRANYFADGGPMVPVDDDDWYQVLLGSLLGDGGVYKKESNHAHYREQHCQEQKPYLDWKASILGRHLRLRSVPAKSGYTGEEQVAYASGNTPMLDEFSDFKETLTSVDRLGPLGLAVWYMDDGHATNGIRISTCGFSRDQNERLQKMLASRFGIDVAVAEYNGYLYLTGGIEAKRRLEEVCRPHIHPSMAYKFDTSQNKRNCAVCGSEFWFVDTGTASKTCGGPVCEAIAQGKLVEEVVAEVRPGSQKMVYDFTVDGTNNFITNGFLSKQCVDEIDVIPKGNLRAYDQAKNGVPTDRGNLEAMTLFTSTRKSRIGKVQTEIDEAEKTGLVVQHWNIIDITEPCQTFRHRPNEPKVELWINDETVSHISEREYAALAPSERAKFYPREGYAGCASCKLFAACKGSLATKQSGKAGPYEEGGTALLLKIPTVIDKFRGATPEFITTEFMCRRPDTSGLVYPRLNAAIHRKTPRDIAAEIEGGPVEIETKDDLIRFLVAKGVRFATGIDWGYNHLFTAVTLAIWGQRAYVVDVVAKSHQELDDKINLTEHVKNLNSSIFADPEQADHIATFRRRGFRMREWSKNAGSVKAGIEIVRAKLFMKGAGATLFFMTGDPDIDLLFTHVRDYHYTTGLDGKFTEEPDDTNDDLPDGLRYGVMNVFGKDGALKHNVGLVGVQKAQKEDHWTVKVQKHNADALKNIVNGLTGGNSIGGVDEAKSTTVKKGGFYWSQ